MTEGIALAREWHGLRAPTAAHGPPVPLVVVAVLTALVMAVLPPVAAYLVVAAIGCGFVR